MIPPNPPIGFIDNHGSVYQRSRGNVCISYCQYCYAVGPAAVGVRKSRAAAEAIGWLVCRGRIYTYGLESKKWVVLCDVCREIPSEQINMRTSRAGQRAVVVGHRARGGGANKPLQADGPQGHTTTEPAQGSPGDVLAGGNRNEPVGGESGRV